MSMISLCVTPSDDVTLLSVLDESLDERDFD